MNTICTELTSRIQTNKEKTRDLLAKTAILQNEKLKFHLWRFKVSLNFIENS